MKRKWILWMVSLLALIIVLGFIIPAPTDIKQSAPTYFENGETVITDSFEVGSSGKSFIVPTRGTPIDGIVIEVPAAAINDSFILSVGYDTGLLRHINDGTASGVVLVLKTNKQQSISLPLLSSAIKITMHFAPEKNVVPVGYTIDSDGSLHIINILGLDATKGTATFLTLQPYTSGTTLITWVFADLL
jgi:hypothetical protein